MGVPKFFRYTSERYPCLNELVKPYQIPEFDNMYLDMNGIIHNCSHPDDSNPHFRITEEKIFQDIFHYLSILFQIIKPKKLFFMAIDGVAPRAKMNQQRGRRFRSAREAETLEAQAMAKGEKLPSEKRFDSNCITPGTVFMARLHEQLRFFVKEKITNDPLWAKVKVVLSGHETPGEGEHKIMDYIRWARSQPNYDPNTRHCLYGLDADLIMLGMCTHEPHFALLREEVKFGKNSQRATSPEETNFFLLHLSLLREYLEQEFIALKDQLPFPYDIEKIVDDWVLMGFLVGNDFIPNLPNMHISNDAMPILYKTYMTVLPTLEGYINEAGELHLERFEVFMQELAKLDKEKFQDTYADLKYFVAKTGRRPNAQERIVYKPNDEDTFNVNVDDIKAQPDADLQALIDATDDMFLEDEDNEYEETSDEEANIEMEFKLHKKDYYMTKLEYSSVTDEVLLSQAECYVRAIQWNLYYYYKGCPSWCWYYPHHYAPYMSDIKGFKDLKFEYELGEPFKPFEQLLAVLPAASKNLLPSPFHELMTDEDSPIVHYYPVSFETDLNGKINDWEAVVLIPFIDEKNLLSAMAPCYLRLTDEELKRNTHGPMMVYNHTTENMGIVTAPDYFPPIPSSHAQEMQVWRQELNVAPSELKRGMLPNARRDMLFPGFPTMRHLKYTTSLKNARVRVFDQPSRNQNMIVKIIHDEDEVKQLESIAEQLLGRVIWVGWPHLTKAKVISVSNEKTRLHYIDKENNNINGPNYTTERNEGNLHKQWIAERSTIIEHHSNRLGIDLGNVSIIVHAVNHKGYKYIIQNNVTMVEEPEWCSVPCGYPLHAIVKDVSAHIIQEVGRFSTPQEAFPTGSDVFLLTTGQYYGCKASVVESACIRSGRIKVCVVEEVQPTVTSHGIVSPYHNAHHAAAMCGISTQMLSRITGCVFVVAGLRNNLPTEAVNKANIGLNLKFNKKNQEVSGYTRRCPVTNSWLYSTRCTELVKSYITTFPQVFDKLAHCINHDVFFEGDIWPDQIGEKKHIDVQNWLKNQPHSKALRRECGSEALEPEEMKALADDLDEQLQMLKDKEKTVTLQVKWSLLYRPELNSGNVHPDKKADFKLYDRVVCSAQNISVPCGATGTITSVIPCAASNTVRLSDKLNSEASYQVMFDVPFTGAMTEELFTYPRFYRLQPHHMINLSYGRKSRSAKESRSSGTGNTDEFGFTYNNALRKDGQRSAFANYSPPVDKKPSPVEPRITASTHVNLASPPDATNLLKSLLKISENENDKKNKEQNQNWRQKNDNGPKPPPQNQTRIPQQPQNWRKESSQNNVKPPMPNEWTNSNFKNQPMPAFQQFVQSHGQQPPLLPQPPLSQPLLPQPLLPTPLLPQPLLPTPHMTQPLLPTPHMTQPLLPTPQMTQPLLPTPKMTQPLLPTPQMTQPQMAQRSGFPHHLPTAGVTLGPSWLVGQNQSDTASSSAANKSSGQNNDKLNHPFVPLQVQTSRRRVQNTGGSSSKKNTGEVITPQCVLPTPQPVNAQDSQHPPLMSKPIKKRKSRIAANLPFQMD